MNISRALKEKNRLTINIQNVAKNIKKFNRYRTDNIDPKQDVTGLFVTYNEMMHELVKLRAAIAVASAPIQEKLASLNALQSQKSFLESLNTDGTPEEVTRGYGTESKHVEVTLQLTTTDKDTRISSIQKQINQLQDEIDNFNATTQINLA